MLTAAGLTKWPKANFTARLTKTHLWKTKHSVHEACQVPTATQVKICMFEEEKKTATKSVSE